MLRTRKKHHIRNAATLVAATALSACSGGSSSTGSGAPPASPPELTGKVIDGYLVGATVCLDNGAGACDPSTPSTITDSGGGYVLHPAGSAMGRHVDAFITSKTTDTATNAAFPATFMLSALVQSSTQNITPLTSMVVAQTQKGLTVAQAIAAVQRLAGSSIDPNADYLATGDNGTATLARQIVSTMLSFAKNGAVDMPTGTAVLDAIVAKGSPASVTQADVAGQESGAAADAPQGSSPSAPGSPGKTPSRPPDANVPVPTYNAALAFANSAPSLGSSTAATVTLSNPGTADAANVQYSLTLPPGFSASAVTQTCGGSMATSTLPTGQTQISLGAATVPAGNACAVSFTLGVPQLALAGSYAPVFAMNGTNLVQQSVQPLSFGVNTPTPTPSTGGQTPGLYATPGLVKPPNDPNFSSNGAYSELDFYITPQNDPGPNSNVFWANQFDVKSSSGANVAGYTGLQTTTINNNAGVGKQFLFSWWNSINAQSGSTGSVCTVSATADDGSAGAQCRYNYNWQAGHTYRFRLMPDAAKGNYWFKVNVTDVTGGAAGDSFDIGSIEQDPAQFPSLATSIPSSAWTVLWTEYFDWNNHRTTCLSVPYASATRTMSGVDAATGGPVNFTYGTSYSNTCTGTENELQTIDANGLITQTGGINQSAQGLVKSLSAGQCLSSLDGLSDGPKPGANTAAMSPCPTAASVNSQGGGAFAKSMWVLARDGSIQNQYNYCLTANDPAGSVGSGTTVESCVPGALNQQWKVSSQGRGGAMIASIVSGLCLAPVAQGSGVVPTLEPCSSVTPDWSVPGNSFSF